jgi:hypothetical protein
MNLDTLLHRPLALALSLTASAAALVCAGTAEAAPIVTAATFQLEADTTLGPERRFLSDRTEGALDEAVESRSLGQNGVSVARAALRTQIDASGFSGQGSTSLDLSNGESGEALAQWVLRFTLDSAHEFSGSFSTAFGDNAFTSVQFVLSRIVVGGLQTLLDRDERDPALDFAGTLEAGDYQLFARSFTVNADPNESGTGRFDLRFDLRDTGAPPNAVPLPSSLALSSLGFLLAGVLRSQRGRDSQS